MIQNGAYNKIQLLTIILFVSWMVCFFFPHLSLVLYLGCMFTSFIMGVVMFYMPHTTPQLAPYFPIGEGIFLGIATRFGHDDDPSGAGIFGTFAAVFLMLILYRKGLIQRLNKAHRILSGFICVAISFIFLVVVNFLISSFAGEELSLIKVGPHIIGAIFPCLVVVFILQYLLLKKISNDDDEASAINYKEWRNAFYFALTFLLLFPLAHPM